MGDRQADILIHLGCMTACQQRRMAAFGPLHPGVGVTVARARRWH